MEDIIFLFTLVLSNNYFIYNNTTYKQIHGCAIGSLVVAIIAYIFMEEIEVQAIKQALKPPKYWKRYVDDSFAILKKNAVSAFHTTLNSIADVSRQKRRNTRAISN